MGFKAFFTGLPVDGPLQIANYSVSEESSPLKAGDSTGSVGTFQITLPIPDPSLISSLNSLESSGYGDLPFGDGLYGGVSGQMTPWAVLGLFGPTVFIDSTVRLSDSRKGFTLGRVDTANLSQDGGTIEISGISRLGRLNIYGIQAQPFVGTLGDAFEYYLSLAEVSTGIFVDDEIRDIPVVFPGWTGELWYYLKLMAASQDCDISLVSGVILLRAIRKRVASDRRGTSMSTSAGTNTLAQSIEIYQYNNRQITDQLVYPPGGWNPEVEVLNVNAGETSEYTLELSASVSSIQTPVMQTFVSDTYSASSVYTIVADDGLPVSPAAWTARGGSLKVEILPDTKRLKVTLRGATGLPTSEGIAATSFSVGLGADTTGNRYSTLRIVGTGVAFDKVKKRIRTGVSAERTATEIGVTIDNPFISTLEELYRTGTRAARGYAGTLQELNGSVISINRRGDSGSATYPTYGTVESSLKSTLGSGVTYGAVETYYDSLGLTTYESVRQYWFEFFRNDDVDQVFGNVQGARIFDKNSRRWYRIRRGTLEPGGIGFSADDDLIHSDMQGLYAGKTYGDVQSFLSPFTYKQVELLGMYSL